ncbi:MAG: metal-dependent hydrolase [Candidatus Doudnabacteria bacterium]|nr:metal-dependent hydrolase [Candidatus Doudnabacteria bacterium]
MLPPGHVVGGYLVARLTALSSSSLANSTFFALTALFAFVPDLDRFVTFIRIKSFTSRADEDHRLYITHAPLAYLLVFLGWIILFPESSLIAYAFILGTWSHFFLDTFSAEGVIWLYPFSKKPLSFNTDNRIVIESKPFFAHWMEFLIKYFKTFTFKLEVILIILALLTLLTTNY